MSDEADAAGALAEAVCAAAAEGRALRITGGGSKAFYGRPVRGEPLSTLGHRGVVDHQPSELVVTARAGTPLLELEAELARHGQMLAFEPPRPSPGATVGGMLAAGLSGPRRPFAGAVRDAVLGVEVLDGRGRRLRFGGVVFKNVAGFDAFRLMAGSLGSLGVILQASFRVAPVPRAERTLVLETPLDRAAALAAAWLGRATPISGLAHDEAGLHVRLSGSEAGVSAAARDIGGEPEPAAFWTALRDLDHPLLQGGGPLWRLALPAGAPQPRLDGRWLWDWGGAQRWLVTEAPGEAVRGAARALGGYATLFRGSSPDGEVFAPLAPPLMALHRRLKAAFDPLGVLNPGRMYADL